MTGKKMKFLRDSQTMRNGAESVTVSLWATETKCAVEAVSSNVNKGITRRAFDDFDTALQYYLRLIGARYCGGWR